MSLTKIKNKETKGKQKLLPKLKAILANPIKTKCPILGEDDLLILKNLLQNAIKDSSLEPRSFATQKGICLGLESSLRKINNATSSCVFISLSIKPHHIISLIARNAEVKDETQPVFAQPKFEDLVKEIFDIQALCMVFPKNLLDISQELSKWVESHRKPAKVRIERAMPMKSVKKKLKLVKENKPQELGETAKEQETEMAENEQKPWSGDFISFGLGNKEQIEFTKLDGDQAVEALSEIMNKIPTINEINKDIAVKIVPMEVVDDVDEKTSINSNIMQADEDSKNSDDFLGDYKALTVHKIKGNPNKKPKKKRKKNKNKKIQK